MAEPAEAEETVYIYTLTDPRTGEVRYVGKSHDPQRRLKAHLADAQANPQTRKGQWLLNLADGGFEPTLAIVGASSRMEWSADERAQVKAYLDAGHALSNDLLNRDFDPDPGNIRYNRWSDPLMILGEAGALARDVGADAGTRVREVAQDAREHARHVATDGGVWAQGAAGTAGTYARIYGTKARDVASKAVKDPTVRTAMNTAASIITQHVVVSLLKRVSGKK